MKNKFSSKNGFTLVELLVAMSLFVVVVALASGIFIQALRTQRATVALIAANNNASLAIEQMMREIRTGKNFTVEGVNSGEGQSLDFQNARQEAVNYSLTNKSIARNNNALTAENILVENLKFNLLAGLPPRITIVLQISALGVPAPGSFINLQTTVSPRVF